MASSDEKGRTEEEYRGGAPEPEAEEQKGQWAGAARGITPDYKEEHGGEPSKGEHDLKDDSLGEVSEWEDSDTVAEVDREAGDAADATSEWSDDTEGDAPHMKDPAAARRQSEGRDTDQ
ncbi:MAG: hypothetical protein M3296_01880 [Actinomycetota bacterium]|nr:hypothetical protein [Actinomycetota bacterium]